MPSILFNGKTYNCSEEMPENERRAFEQLSSIFVDRNGNGIPDFLEGDMVTNVLKAYTSNQIYYKGRFFSNLRELPPEIRSKVLDGFSNLNKLGILPDDPSMITRRSAGHSVPVSRPLIVPASSSVIQEERTVGPVSWILVGAGLLLCAGLISLVISLIY